MRDPRRLGAQRVRVQIALGDLADPPSFRNALRGVDTVVHLAAAIRDQPRGSIEELNGIATWRIVEAAERAGAERFVFFSALGASTQNRARLLRAKALAEQAVREARPATRPCSRRRSSTRRATRWLTLLERLALLPVMPVSGRGRAVYQPIWAEDVADCVIAALRAAETRGARALRARRPADAQPRARSCGPCCARSSRSRPLLHVPTPIVSRALRLLEGVLGPSARSRPGTRPS